MSIKQTIDDLLEESVQARKCCVCENGPLSAAIIYFLEKKEAGEASVTFSWFYREKLASAFGSPCPPACRTARDHVRKCLGRSVETGKQL